MPALKPSINLSGKRNVIPSIDRITEATAEDFKEIALILQDHANIIDGINRVDEQSLFYGFFTTLDLLKAEFPVAQEDGFAVIDPRNGNPQKIATYSLGVWSAEEVKAPIKFYTNKAGRPDVGEEGVWYIVKDEKIAYLWYDGKYNGFGKDGSNGLSAYQIAQVVLQFAGTEEEWLASLVGKSAYQSAVDTGFIGTEAEWIASVQGVEGKSAYQIALDNGFIGTEAEWILSLEGEPGAPGGPGPEGPSAYEIAVANGFQGTEAEWIASIEGVEGKSAYQVAVNNGFAGTEAEWLNSLKGAPGEVTTAQMQAYFNAIVAPIPRSSNFIVAAADHKKDNYCSAALIVTVPTNAGTPIAIGFESHFWQTGTGAVTFVGASGVTVNKDVSELAEIAAQNNAVTLKKIAADSWILIGALKKTA